MNDVLRYHRPPLFREVLLACGEWSEREAWLQGAIALFGAQGIRFCQVDDYAHAVRRVERGGLSGAVLGPEVACTPGLSVMRMIRAVDAELPCWLMMVRATRQHLEEALALGAAGVLQHPAGAGDLLRVMKRVL